MRTILTCWFCFAVAFFGNAQYRFRTITIEDGLTENSITDIFQDSDGYLWFGTQDGISRYDGYTMKNFNITGKDSTSLSDNFLWGFDEDSLGFIWCCSRDGINRIDKVTGACKSFYPGSKDGELPFSQSTSLAIYNGLVYATFSGLIHTLPVQKTYKSSEAFEASGKLKNVKAYSFHVAKDAKSMYLVTNTGLFEFDKHVGYEIPDFNGGKHTSFLPIFQSSADTIWFSNGSILYYLLKKDNSVGKVPLDLKGSTILGISKYQGSIWLATGQGVWVVKGNQVTRRIQKDDKYKEGLPSNYISAIFTDDQNNVWLGTSGSGLCQYTTTKDQFKYLGQELFGRSEMVRGMVQKRDELYLCTESEVYVLSLGNNQLTKELFVQDIVKGRKKILGISNNQIKPTCISLGPDSSIVIGTQTGQVVVLNDDHTIQKIINVPITATSNMQISGFEVSRNKSLWVTSFQGVLQLDSNYNTTAYYQPNQQGLNTNYLMSVYEDMDGIIWLGGNNGIYHFNQNDNLFSHIPYNKNDLKRSPGFNFVTGFVDVGDGNLWMSTYGGGLSKMNKQTKEFHHYTTQEGLVNNVLNGVMCDKRNRVWVSSNKGISVLNITKEEITNYDKGDGLYFSEFMLGAYWQNNAGEMMLGTPAGLVVFKPSQVEDRKQEVPIVLTKLDINYLDRSARLKDQKLTIYPKDKTITVHFAGLHYSTSHRVKYRYQLDGYDADWVETNEVKATYTSLPEGRYTFYINATNGFGQWNETPMAYEWIVRPPYYKTWWFITLLIVVTLGLLVLIIRHFAQLKIKKRLRELKIKEEVHREKQRISRDLHDTVGAQITYLISSIDYESNGTDNTGQAYERLGEKARNIMTQLRNVLWVLDKEEVSFTDFSRKVSEYALKVLAPTGIRCTLDIEDHEGLMLSPGVVSNLFRITQEALNNIVKHSRATLVTIRFGINAENLEITISDNGVGFNSIEEKEGHFGIQNMMSRIKDVGGTCIINASEQGVEIKIQVGIGT